jgi:RNA polymerase sigma factor (sigma-70 family)
VYLYSHYAGALYSIILQIIPNQEVANDILHDAFMSFWRKIDSYQQNSCRLFTWMLSITRNLAIDTIRSRAYRESQKNEDIPEVIQMNVDTRITELPVDQFGMKKTLDHLTPDDRALVELSYFKGYTAEEIADIEEIPLESVRSRIRRVLIHLRQHFK